jgi:hypothetical protein
MAQAIAARKAANDARREARDNLVAALRAAALETTAGAPTTTPTRSSDATAPGARAEGQPENSRVGGQQLSPVSEISRGVSAVSVSNSSRTPSPQRQRPPVPERPHLPEALKTATDNLITHKLTRDEASGAGCPYCSEGLREHQYVRVGPNCVIRDASGGTRPAPHFIHEFCAVRNFEKRLTALAIPAGEARDRAQPNWRSMDHCAVCRASLLKSAAPPHSAAAAPMDVT